MRLVVADDHSLVREGIIAFFNAYQPGWNITQAGTLDELKSELVKGADFAFVDLNMPGMAGPRSFGPLREAYPTVKLAVLTGQDTRLTILECLSAGVHGYIRKAASTAEFENAVKIILSGGIYVPACLSEVGSHFGPATMEPKLDLTKRQQEVMQLLAAGMSNKLIARQMALGLGTVKAHLAALYRTLDVHTRMEAIAKLRAGTDC